MCAYHKAGIGIIILIETLVFSYVPGITKQFSSYRGVWINERNLDNATSGALLSLALTHLLPEGFGEENGLKTAYVDVRGFIMGMPILLLVTIDFLAGHHCGGHSAVDPGVKSLNCSSIPNVAECQLEHVHAFSEHVTLSHLSTDLDSKTETFGERIEIMKLRLKQLFTSRALYLLLTFYGHSILEGTLLGSQHGNAGAIWGMGFGIFAHKWAECLVLNATVTNLVKGQVLRHLCTIAFAACVPIGILIGALVKDGTGTLQAVFQLLAVGFFLYLSFELLTHRGSDVDNTKEFPLWISYFSGAVVMAMILVGVEVLENVNGTSASKKH